MTNEPPPPTYLQPYREALARFGPGFEATLWQSRPMQAIRFDVAMGLLPLGDRRIADLGCGVGDLVDHLRERNQAPAAFLGVDAQAEMIREAESRQGGPDVTFVAADLVESLETVRGWQPDVCVISGTLNTMSERTAWRLVREVFACASIGVVFNFLSDRPHPKWRGKDLRPAKRFRTEWWLRRSLGLTSRVGFRQDYLDGHDATIAMQHDHGSSGEA